MAIDHFTVVAAWVFIISDVPHIYLRPIDEYLLNNSPGDLIEWNNNKTFQICECRSGNRSRVVFENCPYTFYNIIKI